MLFEIGQFNTLHAFFGETVPYDAKYVWKVAVRLLTSEYYYFTHHMCMHMHMSMHMRMHMHMSQTARDAIHCTCLQARAVCFGLYYYMYLRAGGVPTRHTHNRIVKRWADPPPC